MAPRELFVVFDKGYSSAGDTVQEASLEPRVVIERRAGPKRVVRDAIHSMPRTTPSAHYRKKLSAGEITLSALALAIVLLLLLKCTFLTA